MTPQQLESLMSWVREVALDAAMHEDSETNAQKAARRAMYQAFDFDEGLINEPIERAVLTGDNP